MRQISAEAIQFRIAERSEIIPFNVINALRGYCANIDLHAAARCISIDADKKYESDIEVGYSGWKQEDGIEYRFLDTGRGAHLDFVVKFFKTFSEEEIEKMAKIASRIIDESVKDSAWFKTKDISKIRDRINFLVKDEEVKYLASQSSEHSVSLMMHRMKHYFFSKEDAITSIAEKKKCSVDELKEGSYTLIELEPYLSALDKQIEDVYRSYAY